MRPVWNTQYNFKRPKTQEQPLGPRDPARAPGSLRGSARRPGRAVSQPTLQPRTPNQKGTSREFVNVVYIVSQYVPKLLPRNRLWPSNGFCESPARSHCCCRSARRPSLSQQKMDNFNRDRARSILHDAYDNVKKPLLRYEISWRGY